MNFIVRLARAINIKPIFSFGFLLSTIVIWAFVGRTDNTNNKISRMLPSSTYLVGNRPGSTQTTIMKRKIKVEIPDKIPGDLMPELEEILHRSIDRCRKGYYRLLGMEKCRLWLTCQEIKNHSIVVPLHLLGTGIGKQVSLSILEGKYYVAVSQNLPKGERIKQRVMIGHQNLRNMQPSPYIIPMVGICEEGTNSTIVTETCKNCRNLASFISSPLFHKMSRLDRFKMAIQIVGSLNYLHRGFGLPRVHCDLHTPIEALSQYIVADDRRVFMSDVDEIPRVDKNKGRYARCSEEIHGVMKDPEFMAPEQRYTVDEFKEKVSQKPVDEKSDVWKIPDLTEKLAVGFAVMDKLHAIHRQCKEQDPILRPTSQEVLIGYLQIYKEMKVTVV